MQVQTVQVSGEVLERNIKASLYGSTRLRTGAVVWSEAGSEIVVMPETAAVRVGSGWVVVSLDVETDQTGRVKLQLVFAVGRAGDGDGLRVASTLAMADPSGLLSHWGTGLQEAIWSGVLDAIESTSATLDARKTWVPTGIFVDGANVSVRFATGGAQ